MSKLTTPRWTLVQHSAWAGRQDPRFENHVEQASITTHQQLGEIIDAGGVVFDDYMAAEEHLDTVNYPEVAAGASPQPLAFHETLAIDGRSLYLPHGRRSR